MPDDPQLLAAQQRYCLHPTGLKPGNGVRVFPTGDDAYAAMLAAIRGARQEIHFETYIYADDATGREFRDALIERARAGVAVRLMLDGFGSAALPDAFLQTLAAAGAAVLIFRPLGPWRRRWGWNRRNHRKILVVDRIQGFTGGVNISDEYRTSARGGGNWQDMHIQIAGPVAQDLNALFVDTWRREGGGDIPSGLPADAAVAAESARLTAELGGQVAAQALGNHRFRLRGQIRHVYLHAIRAAREQITLANAYFLPDLLFRRVIAAAARRGVDVRILVAGKTDSLPVWYATRRTFRRLLAAGVKIYEMQDHVLHAKCAVVDRHWAIVGSYNLDHRSLFHNLEATVTLVDAGVCLQLETALETRRSLCIQVDPQTWSRRPWLQKCLEVFWYWWRELL